MQLVIVESPTKAKTIAKFLGKEFVVKASYGHVVDLPSKTLAVDVENNFKMDLVVTVKGKKTLSELKKLAKEAETIYIATDPDREGEAIGANLVQHLTNGKTTSNKLLSQGEPSSKGTSAKRIQFHEITKEAIQEALKNPAEINTALVESQQARRILDRLVGYKLSPLLWKKVRYGLSAGRVQSVAVRLIVERERERQAFKAKEYWEFEGAFKNDSSLITAVLKKINGKDFLIESKEKAEDVVRKIKFCVHKVDSIQKKEVKKYPYPPFTTATLQQSAGNLYGFLAKRTMSVAQKLYEEGLITYHRTDSLNLSESFIAEARKYIKNSFGANFLPEKGIFYKTKAKSAQEAHEAIRPTRADLSSISYETHKSRGDYGGDMEKIYGLIWRRAVSCQMTPAVYDQVTVKILSGKNYFVEEADNTYTFSSSKQDLKFQGFLAVYRSEADSEESRSIDNLSPFSDGMDLNLVSLMPSQHFTQPPGRYNTASLIKALEEYGVGRPSTYASIITTIESRGYILRDGRYFFPDDVAYVVNDLLVANFPEVVDAKFTAKMEEELDKIAEGKLKLVPVINDFWKPFVKDLEDAEANLKKSNFTTLETVEEKCPECNSNLVVKLGRYGRFLSCGNFPDCKYMKPLLQEAGMSCPDCKEGKVLMRKTKKGKTFYGCSRYPDCKWASWNKPVSTQQT
jgi:DNA topoisomerase-1